MFRWTSVVYKHVFHLVSKCKTRCHAGLLGKLCTYFVAVTLLCLCNKASWRLLFLCCYWLWWLIYWVIYWLNTVEWSIVVILAEFLQYCSWCTWLYILILWLTRNLWLQCVKIYFSSHLLIYYYITNLCSIYCKTCSRWWLTGCGRKK